MNAPAPLTSRVALCAVLLAAGGAQARTCPPNYPPLVTPDTRYVVSEPDPANHPGERVVADLVTGLIWKQCVEGRSGAGCATGEETTFTWSDALTHANAASAAGFTDWRLPSAMEAASLIEPSCYDPSINDTVFGRADFIWTSTTVVSEPLNAIYLSEGEGLLAADFKNKNSVAGSVRLVRGGDGFAEFAAHADATPDAFAFEQQPAVEPSSTVTSNSIAVSGLTTVTGIKIEGAAGSAYSINGGTFTELPGSVRNGDLIRAQHTSAAAPNASATSTVTIGGVTAVFISTTVDPDRLFGNGFEQVIQSLGEHE